MCNKIYRPRKDVVLAAIFCLFEGEWQQRKNVNRHIRIQHTQIM